jgi:hypothetical protein
MKKLFAALAVGICACVAFASGCATLNTPAKVAAALCPPTNTAIADFNAFSKLYPALPAIQTGNAILTKYQPVVNAVCAEGSTVTSTNLQDLISQGIPAVAAIAATVPMPLATQQAIQAGFAAAELVAGMVGLYENALSSAQTAALSGAAADSIVSAAKMSVKPVQ